MPFCRRSEGRYPALIVAQLEREGLPNLRATVRNLSPSGFMALASEPVPPRSRVRLVLPFARAVPAEVRWSLNGQIGCRIEGRLSPSQIVSLLLLGAAGRLLSAHAIRLFVLGLAAAALLA